MELNSTNVGLIVALVGVLLSFLTYILTRKKQETKEIKDDTSNQTRLEMQLEYISKGIDDIKADMKDMKTDAKAQDEKIADLVGEVVRLSESLKSAHKREDEFERSLKEITKRMNDFEKERK